MKQEEKLEEAKRLYKTANADQRYVLESLFPELKESKDERIRKELIKHLRDGAEGYMPAGNAKDYTRWLSWLEKQGDTNETINNDEFAQGVLRSAAINLITWIDYNAAEGNMCLSNVQCKEIENALVRGDWNKIYAYMKKKLEKQDEKKHIFDFNANNWYVSKVDGKIHNIYNSGVEPKFHEGDWVVWQDKCYKVNYNGCGYKLIDQNGLSTSLEYGTIEENAHLWTIQDAKDGDVLASELCDSIILFRGIKDDNIDFYCDYDFSKIDIPGDRFTVNNGQHYGNVEDSKDFYPATKEQRDLLFQKMKEAYYEWDEEKKELRKIENFPILSNSAKTGKNWSEEDEKCIDNCCLLIGAADNCYEKTFKDDCIHYLQNLKKRIGI